MKTNNNSNTATLENNNSNNRRSNRKPYQPTEAQKEAIRQKREKLKADSVALQELVKQGCLESVNEGLIGIYYVQGHTELKTIHQWNKEGKSVKKGEKALLLWGKPQPYKKADEVTSATPSEETENGTESREFYPLCYVFSQLQVEEREVKNG